VLGRRASVSCSLAASGGSGRDVEQSASGGLGHWWAGVLSGLGSFAILGEEFIGHGGYVCEMGGGCSPMEPGSVVARVDDCGGAPASEKVEKG
jgi:hypothetical protein